MFVMFCVCVIPPFVLRVVCAGDIAGRKVRAGSSVVVDRSSWPWSPKRGPHPRCLEYLTTHVDPASGCMRLNAKFKVVQGTVPQTATLVCRLPSGLPSQLTRLCPFQIDASCLAD